MTPKPEPLSRAKISSEAGELEVRLSQAGSWVLHCKAAGEREWRLLCDGSLTSAAPAPSPNVEDGPLRIGLLLVDRAARRVRVGETEVALGRREFDLLATLASEPTRVFSREELYREVFGCPEGAGRSRTLDSHASRLRVKLRDAGAEGMPVNCWGVGFRLWDDPSLAAVSDRAAA